MKNIIIGTAGHVDHGKTRLIKALSGIDTDRLEEEKKRGITIELGFAHIPNDAGYNIGVIDVPGHEKFIKNMLAGIGGIDFVLFVVAADEGIMPQTREHFEILQALGIDDGIIAITKTDMVDEEWLELVQEDIRDYVAGSFLEGKPMIPVSAKSGANIDLLKEEIIRKCDRESKRIEAPEMFRLPVDRIFTKSGFGTVVTGTLMDGTCSLNDEVLVFPEETPAKIRGIQTYGNDVEQAVAGQRTAINMSGVRKEDIRRGDVIAAKNAVSVTGMLDVKLKIFDSSERMVLNNSRVHLYCGSKEVLAKVILMDRDALSAGEEAYVQFHLEEPIAVRRGDRFIIRFYSPIITIGGGRILDAVPEKHKRNRENVLEGFRMLESGNISDIFVLKTGGHKFYSKELLLQELGMLPETGNREIDRCIEEGKVVELEDGTILAASKFRMMTDLLIQLLQEYHESNPLAEGMPKQELQSRLRDTWHIQEDKIILGAVHRLMDLGTLMDCGKTVSMQGFEAVLTPEQEKLKDRIAGMYADAGIEIPKNDEIYALDSDKRVINAIFDRLYKEGVLVKVDPSYNISQEGWNRVVAAARAAGAEGSFVLADFRDALNTSRKYASVYLAALDRAGITVFDGERRRLPEGR
ncbi:MAG: selenocysteine-specific translation elongation factor [Mogibacterium sp.]|uniref:selenocysteine-specific translation elongation factor n=1 Tax=Mogibacterium sp. TaxID=2049035 RepID=UPI001A56582E|nr:selenocysteine-specific translation elongation factor [Mogibacterium sp.]MBL6468658.1 selenocysteine-specific translation elongation factor [Mogibacterium sp.]